jgi:ATP phosphoribosyltransferase
MLRIAVPNKGALSEPASQMLVEAGYRQRTDSRELVLIDAENDTEFFFLRPRDIAVYVGSGRLDVGITGADLLLDSGAAAEPILDLAFGGSTFRFAARPGTATSVEDLAGKRIATAYPGVLEAYLVERGLSAEVIRLDGAVETAVRLDVADAIADVVSTGTTLRNAGLEIFGEPLLTSQAVLVRRTGTESTARAAGPSSPGCDHRAPVRADGLRHPRRPRGEGGRDHAGHRVADCVAAARAGLVGRAVHGQAQADQSGDGRAVGARRARHHRHRHPRLPPVMSAQVDKPNVVTAKPIIMARIGYVLSAVVFAVFVITALLEKRDNAGAHFARSDQIGTVVAGVVVAALFLMLTWPRLRADTEAVRTRGFLGSWRTVPWDVVVRVDFPSKVRFARLVLPGEETLALYAVQRLDKKQAVETMRALRELFAQTHPTE